MKVQKTDARLRDALLRASAANLPDNPSERGMKASDIKKAFYKPFLDANQSLLSELDRVVNELNLLMIGGDGDAADALLTRAKTIVGAVNELYTSLGDCRFDVAGETDVTSAVNRFYAEYRNVLGEEALLTAARTVRGAINEAKGRADNAYALAEHTSGYLALIDGINIRLDQTIEPAVEENRLSVVGLRTTSEQNVQAISTLRVSLAGVRAEAQGIARSYVLPDFLTFFEFINGRHVITLEEDRDGSGEAEEVEISIDDLKTGDNVLLVEQGVPDFWFEKRTAPYVSNPLWDETYTFCGVRYSLRCFTRNEKIFCGYMHISETDYTVIQDYATAASVSANRATDSAAVAESHAQESAQYKQDVQELVDSIFTVQIAPPLSALNDAVVLPSPTLAML